MKNNKGNKIMYVDVINTYFERVWVGADCMACPHGEACQWGYHADPECEYEWIEYIPTHMEMEELKKEGFYPSFFN